MKTITVEKSFEKEGKSAKRTGDLQVAESLNEALSFYPLIPATDKEPAQEPIAQLLAVVNGARQRDLESNLYQQARLEVVGEEDTIERLANRIVKDREKLGKPIDKAKALEIAKMTLAD